MTAARVLSGLPSGSFGDKVVAAVGGQTKCKIPNYFGLCLGIGPA